MSDYLLDCNHLSAALRKVSPLRERIHQGRIGILKRWQTCASRIGSSDRILLSP